MLIKIMTLFLVSFLAFPMEMCKENDGRDEGCCMKLKKDPPFWVSDGLWMGDKQYENFRDLDNDDVRNMYVAKGSVVYSPTDLLHFETSSSHRKPYSVLSTPKPYLEETVKKHKEDARRSKELKLRKKFPTMFYGNKNLKRAKVGDKGFLDERGLRKITDYIYYVAEDAPVFPSSGGNSLNGKVLRPLMDGADFMTQHCCKMVRVIPYASLQNLCYTNYLFDVFGKDGNFLESTALDIGGRCSVYNFLTAIPPQQEQSFSQIGKLTMIANKASELFNRGGVDKLELIRQGATWDIRNGRLTTIRTNKPQIDLVKLPFDKESGMGPFNTQAYVPDDRGNTDAFFEPDSLCGFLQLAKKWSEECTEPGCRILVGDAFHPDEWGDHMAHDKGTCVDIRPFRKKDDDVHQNTTWHAYNRNAKGEIVPDKSRPNIRYDRERTLKFMNMAVNAGATDIFFNDPKINAVHKSAAKRKEILPFNVGHKDYDDWWEIRGNLNADKPLHDNHIHMCFKTDNPRMNNTCKKGL